MSNASSTTHPQERNLVVNEDIQSVYLRNQDEGLHNAQSTLALFSRHATSALLTRSQSASQLNFNSNHQTTEAQKSFQIPQRELTGDS